MNYKKELIKKAEERVGRDDVRVRHGLSERLKSITIPFEDNLSLTVGAYWIELYDWKDHTYLFTGRSSLRLLRKLYKQTQEFKKIERKKINTLNERRYKRERDEKKLEKFLSIT